MSDEITNTETIDEPVADVAIDDPTADIPESLEEASLEKEFLELDEMGSHDQRFPAEKADDTKAVEKPADDDKTSVEPKEAEPVVPAIPDDIRSRVKEAFGLSDEEISRYGSVDELDLALGRARLLAERYANPRAPANEPKPTEAAPAPQTQQTQATETAPSRLFQPFDPKLSEDVEPSITAAVQGMNEHYAGQNNMIGGAVAELGRQLHEATQAIQVLMQERQTSVQRDIDSWYGSLGEEWKDVFGSGPTSALKPDSPEFKNRSRLLDSARAIAAARLSRNEMPERSALLHSALGAEFRDRVAEKAAKQAKAAIADQLKPQKRLMSQRPQGHKRVDELPKGKDRAVAAVGAKMAEMGIDEDDVLLELPD